MTAHAGRGRLRTRGAALAAVTVAVIGSSCASISEERLDPRARQAPAETADSGLVLSAVPGFGLSDREVLRDDTLAFYEAYRRDLPVQQCMAARNFSWTVEAPYPQEAIGAIAAELAVSDGAPPVEPGSGNRTALENLAASAGEEYFVALYGAPESVVKEALQEGLDLTAIPGASESCLGKRRNAPSIWELPAELEPALMRSRDAFRGTSEHQAFLDDAAACAADFGLPEVVDEASADEAYARGVDAHKVEELEVQCKEGWELRLAAERRYVSELVWQEHADELTRQQQTYQELHRQLRQDEDFLEYLARVS